MVPFALMPFENNGTLKKQHMANTPPEIDKYDTQKNWCLTKMTHFVQCENMPKVYFPMPTELSDF